MPIRLPLFPGDQPVPLDDDGQGYKITFESAFTSRSYRKER
jgi:hypothetical protein